MFNVHSDIYYTSLLLCVSLDNAYRQNRLYYGKKNFIDRLCTENKYFGGVGYENKYYVWKKMKINIFINKKDPPPPYNI